MKPLFLARHAKSSWNHPGLSDHDRPLNTRGESDVPLAKALPQGWGSGRGAGQISSRPTPLPVAVHDDDGRLASARG